MKFGGAFAACHPFGVWIGYLFFFVFGAKREPLGGFSHGNDA